MKKIAFMFATAALFAACGSNAPKELTDVQKDSICKAYIEEIENEAAQVASVYPENATAADSLVADSIRDAAKAQILAKADTAAAEFKAELEARIKAATDPLNAPAQEENKEEAPAEENN